MLADSFCQAIKKIKNFSWEDGPSSIYSSALIKCDDDYIHFFCCDGRSAIWHRIPQSDKKLVGEWCIDVFKFFKVFDRIDKTYEVDIWLEKGILHVKNKRIDLKFGTFPIDQRMLIKRGSNYEPFNSVFLDELQSVSPGMEDDNPIVFNGRQLFYANPRSLLYIPTTKFNGNLCLEQKFVQRLLLDKYNESVVIEGLVYFKNIDTEIALPMFSGKMLKIDPIVNLVNSDYTITCKINARELNHIYDLANTLFGNDTSQDPRITFELNEDHLEFDFYGNKFQILNYLYSDKHEHRVTIPLNHLKLITRPSFIGSSDFIHFELTETMNMFVCSNKKLLFIGGLYRV